MTFPTTTSSTQTCQSVHRVSKKSPACRSSTALVRSAVITGIFAGLVLPAASALAQSSGAPRPSGELGGPGFLKILLTTVLVLALVIIPSIMPSKRGHQD